MTKEELRHRTKQFAHRCVKLALSLPKNKLGLHIQGQLIRCSTSVSANYRAACLAQSKPSLISKISIVVEESDESCFWLEFVIDEKLVPEHKVNQLFQEASELTKIFISSRMTATQKS